MGWRSCPPRRSWPRLRGASPPVRLRCGPGEQGPAGSSLLPTLLWVPCPTCKHQASFSRDSLLACHGESCFSYHCYWGFFTNRSESRSPPGSSRSIRLLSPPAGGTAGHPSPGILAFGNPARGSGGSGTAGWWHRVTRLRIPAGRGDSPPFGFRPCLPHGVCDRSAGQCRGWQYVRCRLISGWLGDLRWDLAGYCGLVPTWRWFCRFAVSRHA